MLDRASNISAQDNSARRLPATSGDALAFEDAPLVDRCRKGDLRAFEALVAKYQDRVYNMILRMCGRPADAEELAQETFLKALEKIGQFRGQSGFYTWLFRIAANLTISHRRRGGLIRFQSLMAGDDGDGETLDLAPRLAVANTPPPEAIMMTAELSSRLMAALDGLDDEFRLAVVLRDVEEMDYSQIAEVLEVPIGTVKSRLHRGREMLKEKLSDLMQS